MTTVDKKSHAIEMSILMKYRDIKNLRVDYFHPGTHVVTWDKDGIHTEEMINKVIEKLKKYSR